MEVEMREPDMSLEDAGMLLSAMAPVPPGGGPKTHSPHGDEKDSA